MAEHAHTNRLIHEKSPYLLQHAHNPVDWFPWGEEALQKARDENRPVLVSIGYATCHWCHVMERESFEDEETARFLNENFVAIKVDREERPDVDKVYMDALHAMGEQGGWPLNVFLTPQGEPFYGGTYWPPQPLYGRSSFAQVLAGVVQAWMLTAHLSARHGESPGSQNLALDFAAEEQDADAHRQLFDPHHGGFLFHHNNKFPPSMGLLNLLRVHSRTGEKDLLDMTRLTLRKMREGGIYDQLGGGLCRYSTDHHWLAPHFEKMLYDNALFVWALVGAWQRTGEDCWRDWALDTLGYLTRDMTHPEGGFYSAEDADSEGEEGKFYVWTKREMEKLIGGAPLAAELMDFWGVTEGGNFEHGANILHVARPLADTALAAGLSLSETRQALDVAKGVLLAARNLRVRPLRDDKILTSWNALAISAFARAGAAFDNPALVRQASRAMVFVRQNLFSVEGRLLRRWRDAQARYPAYLVDYAQLAVAALDLYEATGELPHFEFARHLADEIERLFRNEEGGYFDTGHDAERLLVRTQEAYDGVEPSGNSACAGLFTRLFHLGAGEVYHQRALHVLGRFEPEWRRRPISHPAMLEAVHRLSRGPLEIALVGPPDHPEMQQVLRGLRGRFLPHLALAFCEAEQAPAHAAAGVGLLANRGSEGEEPVFYLCRNMTCQNPVRTAQELLALVDEGIIRAFSK